MSAYDHWSSDLDQDQPAEVATADKPVKVANFGVPAETRSQGGVYADTRQSVESG